MSKSKNHVILLCLVGLILAGIGAGLIREQHLSKGPDDLVSILPTSEDVSLNRIHQVATRDGVKEWMLDATSARYDKAENKAVLKDLSATFFLKDGRKIHLTSRHGVLLTDTKDMEVSKDVVVRSGPYELETERLFYDHKHRSISTDVPIIVRANGVRVTGKSMLFSLDTERAVLTGAVEAVFENWPL
jgi:LPS export ABC transporter protein LptC